eukprot:COSAG01_NODE_61810_length_287_cov_2.196809_1_plen_54_part_10
MSGGQFFISSPWSEGRPSSAPCTAVPILMTDAAARAAELPCWAELGEVSLVATT